MLNKQEEETPSVESRKIKQAGLYGTFGKPKDVTFDDEGFAILGLGFRRVELNFNPSPTPLRRAIFLIEDKETGDVHLTECSRLSQGIGMIRSGKLGVIFQERFGTEDFFDKIRVWYAYTGGDIEKYHLETYLLARLADKSKGEIRAGVMRRQYERMTTEQRNAWRSKYPYAAEVVLKDHEDYNLRRA
jgi:hypothetical protein